MKRIVAIGIAVFLACLLLMPSVSATWCDNDYGKKAPILINNTGGSAQTYYQVELNYTYDSDMNANFSDIRVYNDSDCSLIPLWNESAVASSYNKIWFNATNIPASSWTNSTYYLYYDYSSASTASNITSTFLFGDDFTGTTINEKYLTNWTKSGSNPLQDKTCQNWMIAVYSNYNNEDKIYIFENRNDFYNNTIYAWSFTRANASIPANWTDHGVVFTSTESWITASGHIEPHGIIFEMQSMADAREGVGEGEGTCKWRMYYCGRPDTGDSSGFQEGFAVASESDLTTWTPYSGNPIYPKDVEFGYADTKVCIYNDKVWLHHCKYKSGISCNPAFFSVSDNGIDNWTDKTTNWASEETVLGTMIPFSGGILLSGTNTADTACDAYFTTDGDDKATYSGNPILSGGGADVWDYNIYWYSIVVDKNGSADINNAGTYYLFYIGHLGGAYKLGLAISTTLTEESEIIVDNDKWGTDEAPSLSGGIVTIVNNGILGKSNYGMNHSCRFRAKAYSPVGGGNWDAFGMFGWDDSMTTTTPYEDFVMRSGYNSLYVLSGAGYSSDLGTAMLNNWSNYEILRKTTSHEFLIDDVSKHTEASPHTGDLSPTFWSDSAKEKAEIDWVLVRKYTTPEPTASLGTEESPSATYTPPNPTNLQNTTGNFWVNYTWSSDSGNITNGYNVTWNSSWYNTSNTYMNKSVGASNWANITVWAWNSSGSGTMSAGNVSDEVQAAAADTTFTVSLPVGYTKPVFQPPNSTATNYPPNGQQSHRKQWTVTNINATTLTNYPAYVNVTDEPEMQADWDDVVFTDSSGNLIPYELENYTTGFADYWVNISSLSGSGTYTGWMYYGNDGASSQENPEGVYDTHTKMVHHMQDLSDSTSNNNDATNHGATYTSSGQVDGAYDYNGSSDYWDCGNDASLNITDAITIEAWVKAGSQSASEQDILSSSNQDYLFYIAPNTLDLRFVISGGATPPYTLALDTKYHILGTYNKNAGSNNKKLYINGNLETQATDTDAIGSDSNPLRIGCDSRALQFFFDGAIDNVIISSTARSADWINQSYEMVVNQSSWVSWGGAEEGTPFFNVTNTGNVNLDVRMRLNATVNTITLKADTDNNPTGAKEINTTLATLYSGLGQGNSADIWLWSDFDHTPAQTANRTVYINVSES